MTSITMVTEGLHVSLATILTYQHTTSRVWKQRTRHAPGVSSTRSFLPHFRFPKSARYQRALQVPRASSPPSRPRAVSAMLQRKNRSSAATRAIRFGKKLDSSTYSGVNKGLEKTICDPAELLRSRGSATQEPMEPLKPDSETSTRA